MAKWLRDHIHLAAEYSGIEYAPDSALDDLATHFAPVMLCLLESLSTVVDDAEPFCIELNISESLIYLALPRQIEGHEVSRHAPNHSE